MSYDEKMTIDDRLKYLRRMKKRCLRADRTGRGLLLDKMVAHTELHRKSLTRLMSSDLRRSPRRKPWWCR